jgi:hypothetical protein
MNFALLGGMDDQPLISGKKGNDGINFEGLGQDGLDAFLHALLNYIVSSVGSHLQSNHFKVGLPGLPVVNNTIHIRHADIGGGGHRAAPRERFLFDPGIWDSLAMIFFCTEIGMEIWVILYRVHP